MARALPKTISRRSFINTGYGPVYGWLKAIDVGTCLGVDSAAVVVNVYNADAKIQDDDAICLGASYNLKVTGGATYNWTSKDGSFSSTEQLLTSLA